MYERLRRETEPVREKRLSPGLKRRLGMYALAGFFASAPAEAATFEVPSTEQRLSRSIEKSREDSTDALMAHHQEAALWFSASDRMLPDALEKAFLPGAKALYARYASGEEAAETNHQLIRARVFAWNRSLPDPLDQLANIERWQTELADVTMMHIGQAEVMKLLEEELAELQTAISRRVLADPFEYALDTHAEMRERMPSLGTSRGSLARAELIRRGFESVVQQARQDPKAKETLTKLATERRDHRRALKEGKDAGICQMDAMAAFDQGADALSDRRIALAKDMLRTLAGMPVLDDGLRRTTNKLLDAMSTDGEWMRRVQDVRERAEWQAALATKYAMVAVASGNPAWMPGLQRLNEDIRRAQWIGSAGANAEGGLAYPNVSFAPGSETPLRLSVGSVPNPAAVEDWLIFLRAEEGARTVETAFDALDAAYGEAEDRLLAAIK